MKSDQSNLLTAKSPRMKNHLQHSQGVSGQNKDLLKTGLQSPSDGPSTAEQAASPSTNAVSPKAELLLEKSSSMTGLQSGDLTSRTAPSKNMVNNSQGDSSLRSIKQTLPSDLRSDYSARTVDALNQFSKYTRYVPTNALDLRCEFDLPRFKNLTNKKPISKHEDHQNFLWFQRSRDYTTPSDPAKEANLRK